MITVVGYDGSPLSAAATRAVAAADLVVGGARHLAAADLPAGAATVVLGDVTAAVDRLAGHRGDAVVLASGDPGYFGIVRRLRAAGLSARVLPAPSSVAVAFARVGVEHDDALVVSVHGRDPRAALAAVRAGGKLAVLTDAATGPPQVAAAAPPGARVVVAERLGEADERLTDGTPAEVAARADWREPNVVLVLDRAGPAEPPWRAGPRGPAEPGWAMPEDAFDHRAGMVTKAEVRALALARLGPRPGRLVWDVGAGSGSVGVECARLGAAVVAVEARADDCARARDNARRHGVRLEVVEGRAPAALAGLPDPDAVFVGGGGVDVLAACAARRPRHLVAALAALDRVGPALGVLRDAGYPVEAVQLQANRVVALPDGGQRLAATNPVVLVSGALP